MHMVEKLLNYAICKYLHNGSEWVIEANNFP